MQPAPDFSVTFQNVEVLDDYDFPDESPYEKGIFIQASYKLKAV